MTATITVQMWGNTRAVRIPKVIAKEANLESGTQVTLSVSKEGVLIRPVRRRKSYKLAELLARCKTPNPHKELVRGRRGKEIF